MRDDFLIVFEKIIVFFCRIGTAVFNDVDLDELRADLRAYVDFVNTNPLETATPNHVPSPAVFWHKACAYPSLRIVARRVFAYSYTTAPIESAFNHKRKLQDPTRSTMHSNRFADLFLLAANGPKTQWKARLCLLASDVRNAK